VKFRAWPWPSNSFFSDPVDGRLGQASFGPRLLPNGALGLFCVSDNIRKGAAANAVQIAEELVRRNLI
jgi:aspartate-semialdehyde dehydrogenase